MRNSFSLLLALISLGTPFPASAGQAPHQLDRSEAEQAMSRFTRCVMDKDSRRARALQFVRKVSTDPDFVRLANQIVTPDCVPANARGTMTMRFRPELLRAALFERLYRDSFAEPPSPSVATLPPLLLSQEFDAPAGEIPSDMRFMRVFGDCSARFDPAGAHRLIMTSIDSDEEGAAVQALTPALANCLPAGQTLNFSRSMLRGILSEALFKLREKSAEAAAPVQGGSVR